MLFRNDNTKRNNAARNLLISTKSVCTDFT